MKPAFIIQTLLFFAVSIALAAPAFGQEITATIYGTISDANQAALGGAKITVTNEATGFQRTALSDKSGNYSLPLLPVGTYDLAVEASGFQRYLQKGITLTLNEEVRLNAQLTVGTITETVEVISETSLINLEQGSVGQVIGRRKIEDLPLNGRNFLQLASLQAGVTPNITTITEFTAGHPGQTNFSVNGLRAQSNNFLLDGADNNDGFLGTAGGVPSPDALQEFRILTNAYSAEYGRGGGAIVNIVTRNGTNDFHGSIYDYVRNDFFDARNFFSADVPKLRQNQFGGTFGGPIRHNKTFSSAATKVFAECKAWLRRRLCLRLCSDKAISAHRRESATLSSRDFVEQATIQRTEPPVFRTALFRSIVSAQSRKEFWL